MSASPKEIAEKAASNTSKVISDINNLEKRLAELLDQEVPGSKISFGFTVLSCVAHGNYDRALTELENVGVGLEEYRLFEFRARRYIEHAKSLVVAVRAKHTVGMSAHVNKSKQKELSDRIAEHFLELKRTIIVIEKIQKSVRSEDLSATIYFLKACFFSIAAVFAVYALLNLVPQLSDVSLGSLTEMFHWNIPW